MTPTGGPSRIMNPFVAAMTHRPCSSFRGRPLGRIHVDRLADSLGLGNRRHSASPRRLEALAPMIGNTPLLEIHYRCEQRFGRIYAKYESENLTGSIKDRMAIHTLRCGYHAGELRPGDEIAEASSGNTGISMAAVGAALGHRVRIFMPDWMSCERVTLIRSFGAEVVPVSKSEGGFVGAIELAEAYARKHDHVFLPRQFANPANVEAHRNFTGPEMIRQLGLLGVVPHAFVAGVGTGGSVMGIGQAPRDRWPEVRVHPLEPANSPTLRSGCCVGSHRIQGISDEFVPSIVDLSSLDSIVDVWDGDAILMAQKLSRQLGLAVGISSGANALGAIQRQQELGPESIVVTLLPDSNKKYLSTDLCRCEPEKLEYLAPRIELLWFTTVR